MDIDTNHFISLRGTELSWRQINDEIVVLDGKGSAYFTVNHSGSLLWQMLENGATTSALVDALALAHDLPAEKAARDVETFLALLRDHRLLEE